MSKLIKAIAVALALVTLCLSLVSCGKTLRGTYSATILGSGAEYTFKGYNVTVTVKALGAEIAEVEGTYSIKDGKITFRFESDDEAENEKVKEYSGTFDFEEAENGDIKIGIITYSKQS